MTLHELTKVQFQEPFMLVTQDSENALHEHFIVSNGMESEWKKRLQITDQH